MPKHIIYMTNDYARYLRVRAECNPRWAEPFVYARVPDPKGWARVYDVLKRVPVPDMQSFEPLLEKDDVAVEFDGFQGYSEILIIRAPLAEQRTALRRAIQEILGNG